MDKFIGGPANSVQTPNNVLVGDEFTLDISIGDEFMVAVLVRVNLYR